jgi:hypothetical protein
MVHYKRQFVYLTCVVVCVASSSAFAGGNSYSLGVEGFNDDYKEQDLGNTGKTDGGSVTGYFSHQIGQGAFLAFDARGSYGTEDFSSPTGSVSGIPQWELELRGRVGKTFPIWDGEMSPYIGLGYRYTLTQGKSYTTGLGYEDYDRGTSQFYIPIGASYFQGIGGGWSIVPLVEADFMFYGNADSRLTNVNNGAPVNSSCSPSCNGFQFFNPASNDQHFGIGGRSELMFGKSLGDYSLQAGPFVRYWYVPESDSTSYQNLSGGAPVEYSVPKNTTLQAGVALRVLFQ